LEVVQNSDKAEEFLLFLEDYLFCEPSINEEEEQNQVEQSSSESIKAYDGEPKIPFS
jgi:hypothetical protein